jgi:hypothetical protein
MAEGEDAGNGCRVWDLTASDGAYWVLVLYTDGDAAWLTVGSSMRGLKYEWDEFVLRESDDVTIPVWRLRDQGMDNEVAEWTTRCLRRSIGTQ